MMKMGMASILVISALTFTARLAAADEPRAALPPGMTEPSTGSTAEPATGSTTESATGSATGSTTEPATELATGSTAELTTGPASEPPKSRATAFALSAGGTALSGALLLGAATTGNGHLVLVGAVGSLILPSLGQIYAGQPFTWGQPIRVASTAVLAVGAHEALKCFGFRWGDSPPPCENDRDLAGTLIVAGAIGYGVGALYDIATAGSAVDNFNRKHQLRAAPLVAPGAGTTVGLGFSGTF